MSIMHMYPFDMYVTVERTMRQEKLVERPSAYIQMHIVHLTVLQNKISLCLEFTIWNDFS